MNKEDAIKAINDKHDKIVGMWRRYSESNPDKPNTAERWVGISKRMTERKLKSLKELLEKAESLGIDESEFLIAKDWIDEFLRKINKWAQFNHKWVIEFTLNDLDEKFIHRINVAKKWASISKGKIRISEEDRPFHRLYQDDFYYFFSQRHRFFRIHGYYFKSEAKRRFDNEPSGKSKNEWSRQGMNPADPNAPDDWENYRTDELID